MESVWVFNGVQSQFPSGVFSSKDAAEAWIRTHALSGTLTQYPVNVGMYDYATSRSQFVPSEPEHEAAIFVGKFSGGGIDHFHYEDGKRG